MARAAAEKSWFVTCALLGGLAAAWLAGPSQVLALRAFVSACFAANTTTPASLLRDGAWILCRFAAMVLLGVIFGGLLGGFWQRRFAPSGTTTVSAKPTQGLALIFLLIALCLGLPAWRDLFLLSHEQVAAQAWGFMGRAVGLGALVAAATGAIVALRLRAAAQASASPGRFSR